MTKWIVWSVRDDGGDAESYADIVLASSSDVAEDWVAEARPYATIEGSANLADHITHLQQAAAASPVEASKWMAELWSER